MTDFAGYRPTDDSALRWEDDHCGKCGKRDRDCKCPTLERCPVAEDGKHARMNMEGLYSDYCAHCGSSLPTKAPQISEPFTVSEEQVTRITTAYESGYGRGNSNRDLSQPYRAGCAEALAYYQGWLHGCRRNAVNREVKP